MRNAKKTLSLVMIAIFTTFIVLSGIPTSAAPKKQTKAQIAAAAKVAAAKAAAAKAAKAKADAAKAAAAKAKAAADAAAFRAAAAAKAALTAATKAVENAEKLTDANNYDLVNNDSDFANASTAITAALELVIKVDQNSNDYKGLMARINAANNDYNTASDARDKIVADKAAADAKAAADKAAADALAKAVATAETAVAAVEKAPLVTTTDVALAIDLEKTATTAIAAVTDPAQAAAFTARVTKVQTAGQAILDKAAADKIAADKAAADKAAADKAAADKAAADKAAADKAAADAKAAADLIAKTPAKLVTVSAVDGTITITFDKKPLTAVATTDFTVTESINGAAAVAVTPSNVVVTSDTAVTLAVPSVHASATAAQSVVYNVIYTTGTAVSAIAYNVPVIALNSATAINASQIKLVFNTAVDATQGATATNYTLQNADGSAAATATVDYARVDSTDASGRTVILTLGNGANAAGTFVDLTKTYKVAVINDVTIAAGTALTTPLTAALTVSDYSIPTVVSVSAVGNLAVDVTFSKPVDITGVANFSVKDANSVFTMGKLTLNANGAPPALSSASYVSGSEYTKVRVMLPAALPLGTYSMDVKNVTDAQPTSLKVVEVANNFTVSTPTVATQVLSATSLSQTSVDVKFSTPVNIDITANNAANFQWSSDGTTFKNSDGANTMTKISDTEYKVAFTTNTLPTSNVTFKISGLTDFAGQPVVTYSSAMTPAATPMAALSTIAATTQKKIVVTMTQPVIADGSTNAANLKANWTILQNGVVVSSGTDLDVNGHPGASTTLVASNGGKTFTMTTGSNLAAGTYTVRISNVKDLVANAIVIADQSVVVADTVAPTFGSITPAGNNTSKKFTINYNKAMTTTGANSVLNLANYQYAADGATFGDLPAGSTATIDSTNKIVTITLPSTATLTTSTSKIQVGKVLNQVVYTVADTAGNLLDTIANPATAVQVVIGADVSPTISATAAIAVVDATHIKVPVATAKLGSVVATDFKYSLDGTVPTTVAANAALSTDANGNQFVILTLAGADTIDATTNKNQIRVSTIAGTCGSQTALGSALTSSQLTNNNNANNTTTFAASITSAEILDANHIVVKFAGKMTAAQMANLASNLVIYQNGVKFVDGGLTAALQNNTDPDSVAVITTTNAFDQYSSITLKTAPQDFMVAKDFNGKYVTANTTGVVGNSTLLATYASSFAGGAATANNDTITITFNKEIDPTSIKAGWDGSVSATIPGAISSTGVLTIAGYNFGTVTGMASAGVAPNVTIQYANKVLTITFKSVVVASTTHTTYVPVNTILTQTGAAASTTFNPGN